MSDVIVPDVLTFADYQQLTVSTAVYPKGINYPFLGLAGETGEVAELAKKVCRDHGGVWSTDHLDRLKKELGDVMWYLSAIAHDHGISLQDVAQTNIAKIASRRARGVIGGSGDNR